MRTILLAILILALVPAFAARAEPVSSHKPERSPPSDKLLPLKGAAGGNPCAAFGPGFVRVEGSGTCIKIGGATSVGVSGGR